MVYISGSIPGGTITLMGPGGTPAYDNSGQAWYTLIPTPLWVKITMQANLPTPQQPITLSMTLGACVLNGGSNGTTQTVTQTVIVRQISPLPTSPDVSTWETSMQKMLDQIVPQLTAGQYPSDATYDIARSLFQWEQETNQLGKYTALGLQCADAYMAYLASAASQGGPAGWCIWPTSLRMAYERSGNTKYSDALKSLQTAAYVSIGGQPTFDYNGYSCFRETALALQVWTESYYMGWPDPRMALTAGNLMGQINQLCTQPWPISTDPNNVNPATPPISTFFFGFAMESLVQYYGLTGDVRVIEAVKTACDFIWQNGVNQQNGTILYNMWTPNGVADGNGNAPSYNGLNLLMTCGWEFIFQKTGDATYRNQACFLFNHFNDDGTATGSSKSWAQNTRTAYYMTT